MLDGLSFSDGWTLAEDLLLRSKAATGALFTTSNGYVGIRGSRREPLDGTDGGVLLSGVYETRPYAHAEPMFGLPESYQTLVPVTDPTAVTLVVDGVRLLAESGTWLEHRRRLDLRTGCVTTEGLWQSPAGSRFSLRSRRLASLVDPALVWLALEVDACDGRSAIEVTTELRANQSSSTCPQEPEALARAFGRVLVPVASEHRHGCVGLAHATPSSARAVACAMASTASTDPTSCSAEADTASVTYRADIEPGRPFSVCRQVVFADGPRVEADTLLEHGVQRALEGRAGTFDEAVDGQRALLDEFWDVATVDAHGAPDYEAAVRFAVFQLLQAGAASTGRASPAKGYTGQGYQGHQLWDQEVYVGHAMALLRPDQARAALSFRWRTLTQARARAAELSRAGAQFPWRTIDGTEASPFFPAGSAQLHLNAAIAWAIDHHLTCTGDDSVLTDGGIDVLVEAARLWLSVGHLGNDGRFRIDTVTGPDEYTALVDNNLYTNVMAAAHLESAASQLERLAEIDPPAHQEVVERLGIGDDEAAAWRTTAEAMYVPYDEELRIHGQDETFLQRERWNLDETPDEHFPLQDHYELPSLYRHQVIKQADVVLAMLLQPGRFTAEARRRAFTYYEPLTAHDSSLSAPVHAIVAAEVGRIDLAWAYATESAFVDLDARQGTLEDGLHLACGAGAWLAVVRGFGGFDVQDGVPSFRPRRPETLDRLRFRVWFRGSLLEVDTDRAATTYRLVRGPARTIRHEGETVRLDGAGDEQVCITLDGVPAPSPRHIVLVGLMGTSKTPVGERLASRLEIDWRDGDAELEAGVSMTAGELAAAHGKPVLHQHEGGILLRLLAQPKPAVIASAASTVEDRGVRAALRSEAFVVWLRADVDVLVERAGDGDHRPLEDDVEQQLKEDQRRRHPLFEDVADLVIDVDHRDADDVAAEIAAAAPRL